jgi:hypothetical protein
VLQIWCKIAILGSLVLATLILVVGAVYQWEESWKALQRDTAIKFHNSWLIIAEKSDHQINWHQPELIVEAVKILASSS